MEILGLNIDFAAGKALVTVYLIQFTLFTVLAFVARRGDAIRWSPDFLKSVRVNWSFIAFNGLLAPVAFLAVKALNNGFEASGIPTVPPEFWAVAPAIVPAIVAVIVADFVDYWSHRIRHTSVLWPMHAVHHSDTQMHYLSWYRAHIIELVVIQGGYLVLATWMGASPGAVAGVVIFRAFHQQYCHMKVDWSHGPFGLFLASPRFHRWHHADHPEAWNKNFSNIMPLWDRLFGTYYCPGKCDAPLGFAGNPGENFLQLLIYPFKEWGRMIGNAVRKTAA
ncbi:MAG: sterol desaturase family protein [Henriciella sp.]|nr:sterol desaturase family protein [Henriciella sp.]